MPMQQNFQQFLQQAAGGALQGQPLNVTISWSVTPSGPMAQHMRANGSQGFVIPIEQLEQGLSKKLEDLSQNIPQEVISSFQYGTPEMEQLLQRRQFGQRERRVASGGS